MKCLKWFVLAVICIYSSHMLFRLCDYANCDSIITLFQPIIANSFDAPTATISDMMWWHFFICVYLVILIFSLTINSKIDFSDVGTKLVSYLNILFWLKQLFLFIYDGNKVLVYDYIDLGIIMATIVLFFVKSKKWEDNNSGVEIESDKNTFYVVSQPPKHLMPFIYSLWPGREKPHKKIVYRGYEYKYNWRFTFVKTPYRDEGGYIEKFECDETILYVLNDYIGYMGSYFDGCENVVFVLLNFFNGTHKLEENSKLRYLFPK